MLRKLFRILFSRYTISAVIILADVALLLYLILTLSAYSVIFLVEVLVVNLLMIIAVMNADYNPEYRVSWIVAIVLLPVLGALIYALFHGRGMGERERRRAIDAMERLNGLDTVGEGSEKIREKSLCAAGRAHAILALDPTAAVYSGDSTYYSSGEELYSAMLEALSGAERFIFLEYFIIEGGVMWRGILDILKEKAAAGVEVRVMFDDIGCMKKLPHDYERTLASYGILATRFSPATPRVSAVHNNRDHRKICVVDGRVAFTGGVNIADEYINARERFGHWRDGGVRVVGNAATGFTKLFLSAWAMGSRQAEKYDKYIVECKETFTDGGFYIPFGSGPAPLYPKKVGERIITDIINGAERYVYITTPYLVIGYDMQYALIAAAERGVDVRIITPAVADKKTVKIMTKSAYAALIEAGVRIFEYTPGFIHEKLIVSDDAYATVSTVNLDYRSLVHHFEDGLWMWNTPTVIAAREGFFAALSKSRGIDAEGARLGFFEWVIKCAMKIFAPLL